MRACGTYPQKGTTKKLEGERTSLTKFMHNFSGKATGTVKFHTKVHLCTVVYDDTKVSLCVSGFTPQRTSQRPIGDLSGLMESLPLFTMMFLTYLTL